MDYEDPAIQRIIDAVEYAAELADYGYEEEEVIAKLELGEPVSQADIDFQQQGVGKWGFV